MEIASGLQGQNKLKTKGTSIFMKKEANVGLRGGCRKPQNIVINVPLRLLCHDDMETKLCLKKSFAAQRHIANGPLTATFMVSRLRA